MMRFVVSAFYAVLAFSGLIALSASAQAETRSLKLYYVHTNERAEIVFKRDGRYDQAGLKKLNYFLRDWRRNEPTNMDPRLFDLIWTVYGSSGSRDYIHVVSAYRSPATNNMLRSRSADSGVAKNSQHTMGHAMDFYLPDVKLAKLRAIGLKQQVGGVGYYPTSGSPFVHMDTGSVRHWPRMNRRELMALFPDGRTLHIPSDGKPLQGYDQAMADYKSRRGAPMVYARGKGDSGESQSLFGKLFGGGKKKEQPAPAVPAPGPLPAQPPEEVMVSLPQRNAPVPMASPLRGGEDDDDGDDAAPVAPNAPASSTALIAANVPIPNDKPQEMLAMVADKPAETTPPLPFEIKPVEDAPVVTAEAERPQPSVSDQRDDIAALMAQADRAPQVPLPGTRPQQNTELAYAAPTMRPDTVLQATTPLTAQPASEPVVPQNKPAVQLVSIQDSQMRMASDQISKFITDSEKAARLPSNNVDDLASLIDSDHQPVASIKSNVVQVPRDDEYRTPLPRPVSRKAASSNGAKSDKPTRDAVMDIISNESHDTSRNNLSAEEELRLIPETVLVSGLKKDDEALSRQASLTGSAVDFKTVARIYSTY